MKVVPFFCPLMEGIVFAYLRVINIYHAKYDFDLGCYT